MQKFNSFKEIIEQVRTEDSRLYCEAIEAINRKSLDTGAARALFKGLDDRQVAQLTDTQLLLIRIMKFKGGYNLQFYSYRNDTTTLIQRKVESIEIRDMITFNTWDIDVTQLLKDDMKYLPLYHQKQWRAANPSTTKRKTRGTGFVFKMDPFSLTIFQNSITKEFLRTEAKNLVMQVNTAYRESSKNETETRIRNKFYGLILSNTPVQTKALLNELMVTELWTASNSTISSFYELEEGEAISMGRYINYMRDQLVSYMTSSYMNDYAVDICTVTHNNGIGELRDQERQLSAASVLLTIHARTGNDNYLELAQRMIASTPAELTEEALSKTRAVETLRTILKQGNTNARCCS